MTNTVAERSERAIVVVSIKSVVCFGFNPVIWFHFRENSVMVNTRNSAEKGDSEAVILARIKDHLESLVVSLKNVIAAVESRQHQEHRSFGIDDDDHHHWNYLPATKSPTLELPTPPPPQQRKQPKPPPLGLPTESSLLPKLLIPPPPPKPPGPPSSPPKQPKDRFENIMGGRLKMEDGVLSRISDMGKTLKNLKGLHIDITPHMISWAYENDKWVDPDLLKTGNKGNSYSHQAWASPLAYKLVVAYGSDIGFNSSTFVKVCDIGKYTNLILVKGQISANIEWLIAWYKNFPCFNLRTSRFFGREVMIRSRPSLNCIRGNPKGLKQLIWSNYRPSLGLRWTHCFRNK